MDSAVIVATAIICCIATSTVQLVEASGKSTTLFFDQPF